MPFVIETLQHVSPHKIDYSAPTKCVQVLVHETFIALQEIEDVRFLHEHHHVSRVRCVHWPQALGRPKSVNVNSAGKHCSQIPADKSLRTHARVPRFYFSLNSNAFDFVGN